MALYSASRIRKPTYFRLSPLKLGRGKRRSMVIGFDSEAERGKPFLFQFSLPPTGEQTDESATDLIDVGTKKHVGMEEFFSYLADHCKRHDVEYIVFGFNLQYEWTQIFHDLPDQIKNCPTLDIIYTIQYDDGREPLNIRILAMNDKRYTLTAEIGKSKRRVRFLDAMAYFPMSLDNASEVLGIGAKHPKPAKFSRKARRSDAFVAYAKQDAILTRKLGEYIISLHEQFDVASCMSAPHFASRTFRRNYLTSEIPMPDEGLEQYGLDSYHGGKNGYYLHKPVLLKKIGHYDIRSAYPEAMHQLPDPTQSVWVSSDKYRSGEHAIWEITGRFTGCKYKSLPEHGSDYIKRGSFANLRVTSYEVDAALALGEIEIYTCKGWMLRGPSGGPLAQYVDDFYSMKRNATNSAERATAKLFLNSLYGKFFQKVPLGTVTAYDLDTAEMIQTNPDQDFDYEAGGLYHPPLASLITGYVRAKIHKLEHKYKAIMTSTDGFFAYNPPDVAELGDELGMLSYEIGSLRIWRERLYAFTPDDKTEKPTYAMHGFRGTLAQLRRMPLRAGFTYAYGAEVMVTLKMSTRRYLCTKSGCKERHRYQPGEFAVMPFDVKLASPP